MVWRRQRENKEERKLLFDGLRTFQQVDFMHTHQGSVQKTTQLTWLKYRGHMVPVFHES